MKTPQYRVSVDSGKTWTGWVVCVWKLTPLFVLFGSPGFAVQTRIIEL